MEANRQGVNAQDNEGMHRTAGPVTGLASETADVPGTALQSQARAGTTRR
jgi:hypothetical protein